jgi:hypothetical protein
MLAGIAGWALVRTPTQPASAVSRWTLPQEADPGNVGLGIAVNRAMARDAYAKRSGGSSHRGPQLESDGRKAGAGYGGWRWALLFSGLAAARLLHWPDRTAQLKKVPLAGGPANTLCEDASVNGASGRGCHILFAGAIGLKPDAGVRAGEASARSYQRHTDKRGELTRRWPQVLPGGHSLLFTIAADERPTVSTGTSVAAEPTPLDTPSDGGKMTICYGCITVSIR